MFKKVGYIIILLSCFMYLKPRTVFMENRSHTEIVSSKCCSEEGQRDNNCNEDCNSCFISTLSFQINLHNDDLTQSFSFVDHFYDKEKFSLYKASLLKGVSFDVFHPPII